MARAKHVAIFGAGITGLTAAHELVERGYQVEIFEPEPPSPFEKVCAVGGMARTQWARAERPPGAHERDLRTPGGMVSADRMPTDLERRLEERVEFPTGGSILSDAARAQLARIADLLQRHRADDDGGGLRAGRLVLRSDGILTGRERHEGGRHPG